MPTSSHEQLSMSTAARSGAPLGTIGKNLSTACGRCKTSGVSSQVRRFYLQSFARELMPREAVANCLRRPVPLRGSVDLLYAPAQSSAHYGGLMVCKSVWLCPVCAAKISERRRVELSQGLQNWAADASGVRRVLLVTFTLSHRVNDSLSRVLAVLKRARGLLLVGRWWTEFKQSYGIVGQIRALEVTYGANGWHPHLHVLLFFDVSPAIIPFEDAIKLRWSAAVKSAGGSASYAHGCDVRFSDADIAEYVAKWGKDPVWTSSHEMTKAVVKTAHGSGRTPMELLIDYAGGDADAGRLWLQYAVNFKGQRQLFWSPGLRALLGLEDEKSDEELAEEQDEIAIVLAQLNREQWAVVLGNDARGDLLNVVATGDVAAVWTFLYSLGVPNAKPFL